MAVRYDCSDSAPSSLPSPFPKSPPEYPDLYGKGREMAKIQVLEREIGYLEAELKSVDGLQPASRSCEETVDFVAANSDPLIPTFKKNLRRYHRFRKWLGGLFCFGIPRIYCCCCYSGCDFQNRTPQSCHCCNFDCNWTPSCPADCLSCSLSKSLRWKPTTPNCLSCALPDCLRCRHTTPNCLSCALTDCLWRQQIPPNCLSCVLLQEPLQWQPNWFCCCSCPDLQLCKNTSFGRLQALPDCSFTKCKCSWYCLECPSIHPSCCFNPCYTCS